MHGNRGSRSYQHRVPVLLSLLLHQRVYFLLSSLGEKLIRVIRCCCSLEGRGGGDTFDRSIYGRGGQFMRNRKEIENNNRIKYKFAPLVQYIPSFDRYIFIFRNLYWTNLARLTILKCGKSGREMGTCCPLIRFSQFCLLNGPRMTRNKFYVDVPSDIFALKVSSSPFHLDFYEVDATRSPIRYAISIGRYENGPLNGKYFYKTYFSF